MADVPSSGLRPDRPAGGRQRDSKGHFLPRNPHAEPDTEPTGPGGQAAGGGRDGSAGAAGGGPGPAAEQPAAAGAPGSDQAPQAGAGGAPGGFDPRSLLGGLGGLFGAPPPSAPPGEVQPLSEAEAGSGDQLQAATQSPLYYESIRTLLLASTGAIADVAHWQPAAMTDFEATCLALGVTRYAERQPGSLAARAVEESDLVAIGIGGGVYIARNAVVGISALVQRLEEARIAREAAARAADQPAAG